MADRPLTDLQVRVLRAMRELTMEPRNDWRYAFTPNEIGYAAGAKIIRGGGHGNGRGSGHRVFGAAQQIIPVLTTLRRNRKMVDFTRRDDGKSGTAYYLSDQGHAALEQLGDAS